MIFPWLNDAIIWIIEKIGIDGTSRLGVSVNFFIYDVIQITILLSVMIFFISYLRSYFPPERTRRILEKFQNIFGNFIGSLLGVISPFCSCSSIPIFIGLVSSGVPLGITFSFLITSPIVNEAAIVLLYTELSEYNASLPLLYIAFGILIGVIGGFIIGKMKLEGYVEEFVYQVQNTLCSL